MNFIASSCRSDQKLQNARMIWQEIQNGDTLCTQGSTYVTLLKAAAGLEDCEWGLQIHAEIAKAGLLQSELHVGSTLIYMYAKCGSLVRAHQAFQNLPVRDEVAWTVLIAGYFECGHSEEALGCFEAMQNSDVLPNRVTYIWALKACSTVGAIAKGEELHSEVERRGLDDGKLAIGSTLISMYTKFGALTKAQEVFYSLPARSVASWTSLIAGYAEQGYEEEALDCLKHMQAEGVPLDAFTFACGLKACGTLRAIDKGEELHAEVDRMGLGSRDIFIGNTLVDMYAKWGMPLRAQEVFDKLSVQEVVSWTALIVGYTEAGLGEKAFGLFEQMQIEGTPPNVATYVCILKTCGTLIASVKGREVHTKLEALGLMKRNLVAANSLVDMYIKCGMLTLARAVFDVVQDPDVVLWTTLMTGYVGQGDAEKAFECFEKMQEQAVRQDVTSFVCGLSACGSLKFTEKGRKIHSETEKNGSVLNEITVSNMLVDMYTRCGKLDDAQAVFDRIHSPNVISWNALLTGYVTSGLGNEALRRFDQMQQKQVSPDTLTYVCSLKACGIVRCADVGKELHMEIEKRGFLEGEDVVGNSLVNMYAKCDFLVESHLVFNRLCTRDVVSWNSLIGGYVENGHSHETLRLVESMQRHAVLPNAVTYLCVLKACTNLEAIEKGQEMHNLIEKSGLLEKDPSLWCALVDMYAKCGLLTKALDVFNQIPVKDVVSWTALIAGYVNQGCGEEALDCFEQMRLEGIAPNAATFVSGLKACSSEAAVKRGQDIHAEIERRGLLEQSLVLGNALIDMYTKCGLLDKAQTVFEKILVRNVVSWTSLIVGYTEHGPEQEALKSIELMQLEGISPDSLVLACGLKLCGIIGDITKGQEFHAEAERKGFLLEESVIQQALVEMYIKCDSFTAAQLVFDKLVPHDVASWSALISGYSESGLMEEALQCFERMQCEGVTPNSSSLVCCLKACGTIGALGKGCDLHMLINRTDILLTHLVGNTLLDMYAKCGDISKAQEVFVNLPIQDLGSWTALISRYVEHDQGEEALKCFDQMQMRNVFPDCTTYVCVLKACGVVGGVVKGRRMHTEIEKEGRVEVNPLVGNTLVSMYATWGFLPEAECVFQQLPNRDLVSWNSLMAGYAEIGESEKVFLKFKRMLGDNLKPDSVTFLVLLNACNRTGLLNESQGFIDLMSTHGIALCLDHFTGAVDLLCRTGHLENAIELIRKSPFCSNEVAWRTILNLCRKWGNSTSGKQIFKHAMSLDIEEDDLVVNL